jgi:hypothetical protein
MRENNVTQMIFFLISGTTAKVKTIHLIQIKKVFRQTQMRLLQLRYQRNPYKNVTLHDALPH